MRPSNKPSGNFLTENVNYCGNRTGERAMRLGFAEAEGDMLMILDADMTLPLEDLLRFA
jgi:hypothetical protein